MLFKIQAEVELMTRHWPVPFHESLFNRQRLNKSFDQTFSKVWPPAGPPEANQIISLQFLKVKNGTGDASSLRLRRCVLVGNWHRLFPTCPVSRKDLGTGRKKGRKGPQHATSHNTRYKNQVVDFGTPHFPNLPHPTFQRKWTGVEQGHFLESKDHGYQVSHLW